MKDKEAWQLVREILSISDFALNDKKRNLEFNSEFNSSYYAQVIIALGKIKTLREFLQQKIIKELNTPDYTQTKINFDAKENNQKGN